jgi:hypothetical protein
MDETTTDTGTAPPRPEGVVIRHPVVRKLTKHRGKQRTRTSSRGSRRLTEIERRVSKATRRVSKAVYHGVDTYIDHRDQSKERRRDGAIVDFVENVSYGVSKAISEASPVLHDAAEALNTRRFRQQIRRIARGFARLPLVG